MKIDRCKTLTENLYYQIFEEWPEHDCPEYALEFLTACVASEYNGGAVCEFFGLGCDRVESMDSEQLQTVCEALEEMREHRNFLYLFRPLYSGRDDAETWQKIADKIIDVFWDNRSITTAFSRMLISTRAQFQRENEMLKKKVAKYEKPPYPQANLSEEE